MAYGIALLLLLASAATGASSVVIAVLLGASAEMQARVFASLVLLQVFAAAVAAFLWRRTAGKIAEKTRIAADAAAAEAGRQSTRLRSDVLSIAAHEVRTPLGGVLGLLDLVLAVPGLPRAARADAAAARHAAADLMLLLRDLIEVPGAAPPPLASVPFRIDELMEQVVTLLRARAAARGNALATAVAAGTHPAWSGDPPRIRQILTNMVANAIRFTEAGEVRIEARETAAGALEFSVVDTGRGIPPERLEHLFDRWTQSDGGTGLGLSICRDLAERMGGGIVVHSAPGRGSSFTVTLPLPQAAEEDVALPEAVPPTIVAAAPRPGPPVLVVDDVPVNRRLLGNVLDRVGYAHELAADAGAALEMVQARSYAAVLMDLHMPAMDGMEATRRLRALPGAAARLPVLAVTAQEGTESRDAALAAGMDGYVVKPVAPADLVAALAEAIAARAGDPPESPGGEADIAVAMPAVASGG